MSGNEIFKKQGEDWDFFFKIQNPDKTFKNLNGCSYSFVLEDKNKVEVIRDSGDITLDREELIQTISADLTKTLQETSYFVEFKIVDTEGRTSITDKVKFYTKNTLHYN